MRVSDKRTLKQGRKNVNYASFYHINLQNLIRQGKVHRISSMQRVVKKNGRRRNHGSW